MASDLERVAKGLDRDGFLTREGSLARVPPLYAALVADARTRLADLFGGRLHSAYLYGSVPRGTPRPGRSDLDLLVALREEPTPGDRAACAALDAALNAEYDVIDGSGTLLYGAATLLGEAERYDMGWFVACLCTPLIGDDLARMLPRYRPDRLIARDTNGDLAERLPRWRRQSAAATSDDERRRLSRAYARHLVRTAFMLVMPRWGGWTSDLTRSAEVFARFYPERGDQVRAAAVVALDPVADPGVLARFVDDLGPWLAAEYDVVIGHRSPRR